MSQNASWVLRTFGGNQSAVVIIVRLKTEVVSELPSQVLSDDLSNDRLGIRKRYTLAL